MPLQVGEAVVLAPTALILVPKEGSDWDDTPPSKELARLERRYVLMRTRRRITKDGGASVMVLDG